MGVEIDLVYQGDLLCSAKHGPSGDTLNTDAPVDNGGKGSAFSPTDLVATALGACLMTIMGIVAKRSGWNIDGMTCHVVKEMVADPVRRIGKLTAKITLPAGCNLDDSARRKLEAAAHTCPVKQSLHPEVAMEFEFIYP